VLHTILLFVHNLLRWVVLGAAVAAVGTALSGLRGKRPVSAGELRAGLVLTIALDTQVLLGLALYFGEGSIVRVAMANVSNAMKSGVLRFWLVEHPFAMLAALTIAHVGRVAVKRAKDDATKHRRALVGFGLALLALLAGVPWPFMAYGRPLLPHG
jgi:hypothetical protein